MKKGNKIQLALTILITLIRIGLVLFGGLLIGGSCSYVSIAGPMNWDFSSFASLFGVIIICLAFIRTFDIIEKERTLFGCLFILYGLALFALGRYVMDTSSKGDDCPEGCLFPPNQFSVLIYWLTSFIFFAGGIIMQFDDKEKIPKQPRYKFSR